MTRHFGVLIPSTNTTTETEYSRLLPPEYQAHFARMWGDDQYENFKEDIVPPFCVLAYDDQDIQPWAHRRSP